MSSHLEKVEKLVVEMGFERDKAVAALQRSDDNIDRAVNYLFDAGDDDVPDLFTDSFPPPEVMSGDTNVIRADAPLASDASAFAIIPSNYNTDYANPSGMLVHIQQLSSCQLVMTTLQRQYPLLCKAMTTLQCICKLTLVDC